MAPLKDREKRCSYCGIAEVMRAMHWLCLFVHMGGGNPIGHHVHGFALILPHMRISRNTFWVSTIYR